MRKKEFSFKLSNFRENAFFMKELKWEIFTNRNFANFAINTLYLAFKIILKENQSGWSTTFHSAQFHFNFLLFTF